jgi:transposase-like protein
MSEIVKFTRLIARQKESGLTVRSFCLNEGIAPSTFYYWQKKIRKESGENHFIPLVVKSSQPVFNQTLETNPVRKQKDDNHFEITYPNGITLRVKTDMDLSGLRALISLMD